MAPNATELEFVEGSYQSGQKDEPAKDVVPQDQVVLKLVRSTTTLVAHVFVGIVVGAAFLFAFRDGVPSSATNQHLVLCVIGYQLLMAEAILSLAPDSWLSTLKLKHKRRVHLTMQVVGSLLAVTGSFIKIADKEVHWTSLHGRFALVALVFTTVSLVNGLASLYAYEFRRVIPGNLSKITHICFGIVAFVAASICLSYGMDKGFFRGWATTRFADTLIIFTLALATIVIVNPFITFYTRLRGAIRK